MPLVEKKYKNIRYGFGYPDAMNSSEKFPVVFFLHGIGSRCEDISILFSNTISDYYVNHNNRFILVEPLCTEGTWFDIYEQLLDFIGYIRNETYCDRNRVSICGNSMGGYGCWMLAQSKPEWFSAAVPVCGGGMVWNADRLVNMNIRAFHGELDDIVIPDESRRLVDAINSAGGHAELTIYPGVGHDSWTPSFSNESLYEWLINCRCSFNHT